MAEQNIKSRIQLKTDSYKNWSKATGFIPKKGEAVIYQAEGQMTNIKIGDGSTAVTSLPFILEIDYVKSLAFDTSEIVVDFTSTSSVLGVGVLGQMILGKL